MFKEIFKSYALKIEFQNLYPPTFLGTFSMCSRFVGLNFELPVYQSLCNGDSTHYLKDAINVISTPSPPSPGLQSIVSTIYLPNARTGAEISTAVFRATFFFVCQRGSLTLFPETQGYIVERYIFVIWSINIMYFGKDMRGYSPFLFCRLVRRMAPRVPLK